MTACLPPTPSQRWLDACARRVVKTVFMPTPLFNLRLPDEEREVIAAGAKRWGAQSVSAFIRDTMSVVCSGDVVRIQAYAERGASVQLALSLTAPETAVAAKKRASVPRKGRKERKRRGRP